MNMSFYTASVGAMMQQRRMNVQANNIANVNHYGFKAEKASFSQLMYRDVIGIDEAELPKGTGTRIEKTATDFSSSGYFDTGYLFDYAIVGDGFFALYDPKNGEISFTRDGSFSMSQFFTTPAQPEARSTRLPARSSSLSRRRSGASATTTGVLFLTVRAASLRSTRSTRMPTWT